MKENIDRSMIRNLVKEVISEVVAGEIQNVNTGQPKRKEETEDNVAVETVTIASDADLSQFVNYMLRLSRNTEAWLAVEAGQRIFRLGNVSRNMPKMVSNSHLEVKTEKIEKGLVNETRIAGLTKEGVGRLILSKSVVLTPLGRDKARDFNMVIEREKP